jgi:1,4-alpha-glucan branching enzyme
MRKATRWVLLPGAVLLSAAALAPAQNRGGQQQPAVVSPEVSPEKKITFRVRAPKAEAVRLVGSDMPRVGQGMAMKKGEEGVWEATVGPVPPGAYRYHFSIPRPANRTTIPGAWCTYLARTFRIRRTCRTVP